MRVSGALIIFPARLHRIGRDCGGIASRLPPSIGQPIVRLQSVYSYVNVFHKTAPYRDKVSPEVHSPKQGSGCCAMSNHR